MSLIKIFTDHILERKSLKEYVKLRKSLNETGEFTDRLLIHAEENIKRLKQENPAVYDGMYEVLKKIYERNAGLTVEYPIDFVYQILKMYAGSSTPQQVFESYRRVLKHHFRDNI